MISHISDTPGLRSHNDVPFFLKGQHDLFKLTSAYSIFLYVLFQYSTAEKEKISPLNFLCKRFYPIYSKNRFAHHPVEDVTGRTIDPL